MDQIMVYRKDTGEIVYVPEHWMDHPVLSQPFRKTPSQKAREADQASTPRAGEVANSKSTNESAKAGEDDKKE